MPDERSADFSFVHAFGWSGSRRRVDPFAPRRGPAREHPFEHAPTTVHRCAVTWIEEMFAVEVVGARSAVKWHLGLGYFSAAALAFGIAGEAAGAPVTRAGAQVRTEVPPLTMS